MMLSLAKSTSGRIRKTLACGLSAFILIPVGAVPLGTAAPGPTLELDYGRGQPLLNSTVKFMYFVPLISPEPVAVFTNAGSTHCARVTSSTCHVSGGTFLATCGFEFGGAGYLRNVLDHTELIRRHLKELKAGGLLRKQLASIDVAGQGSGEVIIEGTVTNGLRSVDEVRLRFNHGGNPSPVCISLQDLSYRDGVIHAENEIIARVNTLVFRRSTGTPTMQITVASLKKKDAGDGVWQNFIGGVEGLVANQLLPPIAIDATGHKAMLDFGLALSDQEPKFTFPFATRLIVAAIR